MASTTDEPIITTPRAEAYRYHAREAYRIIRHQADTIRHLERRLICRRTPDNLRARQYQTLIEVLGPDGEELLFDALQLGYRGLAAAQYIHGRMEGSP